MSLVAVILYFDKFLHAGGGRSQSGQTN